jgi:hypothetical protein
MQNEGLDSFYFFRVDDFWIVDATKVPMRTLRLTVSSVLCASQYVAEAQSSALHQPLMRP